MKQATPEQLEALSRLRDPAFAAGLEFLRHCLAEADIANRTLEGAQLHRSQGEAKFIADLIERIEHGRDILQRRAEHVTRMRAARVTFEP